MLGLEKAFEDRHRGSTFSNCTFRVLSNSISELTKLFFKVTYTMGFMLNTKFMHSSLIMASIALVLLQCS